MRKLFNRIKAFPRTLAHISSYWHDGDGKNMPQTNPKRWKTNALEKFVCQKQMACRADGIGNTPNPLHHSLCTWMNTLQWESYYAQSRNLLAFSYRYAGKGRIFIQMIFVMNASTSVTVRTLTCMWQWKTIIWNIFN